MYQVACTNWKRVLMVATGKWPGNDPMEIPADQAHSPGTFQRLTNYTLSEIERMLATYDKLIVVRHPLERLLSAYRNKLEAKHEKSSRYFQTRFGKKIIRVSLNFCFFFPLVSHERDIKEITVRTFFLAEVQTKRHCRIAEKWR